MDWDNLRFFLELSRTGTLVAAARRLAVDHTTVSRRIQALEKHLGASLFTRQPAGMALTEAGREMLPRAEAMERAALALQGAGDDGPGQLSGAVRIGATEGFGTVVLAPRLALFAAGHPRLAVDLVAVSKIVNISRREADIVVSLERPVRGPFVVTRLCDYALCLYASDAYLQAHAPLQAPDDLRRHSFIGYVDDLLFSKELQYLQELKGTQRFSLRSTSVVAQQYAASAGAGIAVLPAFLADRDPLLRRVLPEQVAFRRTFWMSMPQEVKHLARMRAVWDQLRRIATDHADRLMPPALAATLAATDET